MPVQESLGASAEVVVSGFVWVVGVRHFFRPWNVRARKSSVRQVEKMRGCNCTLPETTGKPENFIECLDVCVFQCKKVRNTETGFSNPVVSGQTLEMN